MQFIFDGMSYRLLVFRCFPDSVSSTDTSTVTFAHQLLIVFAPAIVALRLVSSNQKFGTYRRLWRYTGLTEGMELGCSVLTVATVRRSYARLDLSSVRQSALSYGIIAINAGLCFSFYAPAARFARTANQYNQRRHWRQPVRKRALAKAGDAGRMVLRKVTQQARPWCRC